MAKISLRSYGKEIETLIDRGQYDQALAHCRHILRYYPKHIDTYRLMAKAYLEGTRYGDASDVFQRVLSSIPDDFVSQLGMSIIREDEGNLDAAIWHMERAFEIQPANVAIQSELRRLYGRRDGMEPPRVRLTRGALARMYFKGELYQQAISELRATLNSDPSRTDLQVLLAQAYLRAGQRVESADTCAAILKKLPYCLEANRILAEIMVGTEHAQDAAIYRQRAIAMSPYMGQVSPKAPSPERVPDEAVVLERLDLKAEPAATGAPAQPQWASSLGVEIEPAAQKKEELPDWLADLDGITQPPAKDQGVETPKVSPFVLSALEQAPELAPYMDKSRQSTQAPTENIIPDWMKEAGWVPTTEGNKEAEIGYSLGDEISAEGEGLARAEIPSWLRAIAPKEAFEQPEESMEIDPRLAEALDSAAAPWLEEMPPGRSDTIASWLEEKDKSTVTAKPSTDEGIPAWLAAGAGLAAAGLVVAGAEKEKDETPSEEAPAAEISEELPEWLSGAQVEATAGTVGVLGSESPTDIDKGIQETAAEPQIWNEPGAGEPVAAGEIPDWLRSLEPAMGEPGEISAEATELPEWLSQTSAVSQIDQMAEAPQETTPAWLSELRLVSEAPEEQITSEEEETAIGWLEDLTVQPGVSEAEFPSTEEGIERLPEWAPGDRESKATQDRGVTAWEIAGLGAAALGAAALGSSQPEDGEMLESEPIAAESFVPGEWLPETFEHPEEVAAASMASDLFEPKTEAEILPEDVFPEWLRQVNPEDMAVAEEAASPEDTSLPDWLRQMEAGAEPTSDQDLWTYQPSEALGEDKTLDWLQKGKPGDETADMSWLSEAAEEPETVDEWLRTQALQSEPVETEPVSPIAEIVATGVEEPQWLPESIPAEEITPKEEEPPSWMAGLAAGAAAAALVGKDAESQPFIEEELEVPTGIEELPEVGEAEPELAKAELPADMGEAAFEISSWLEEAQTPAEAAILSETVESIWEEEPVTAESALQPVETTLMGEAEVEAEGAMPEAEAAEVETGATVSQTTLSDEEAAFAWLESLAVKQGATEALMYTPEERQEEPPEWIKQASLEEPEPGALGKEPTVEPALEAGEELTAVEELPEIVEPAEDTHLPEWLLAAAAAGAILTGREKEEITPVAEETQPTKPIVPAEEVEEVQIESVEPTEVAPATATEADIDSAYAWLESLAVRQGAEEALLLTPEERQEEPPEWVKIEAEAELGVTPEESGEAAVVEVIAFAEVVAETHAEQALSEETLLAESTEEPAPAEAERPEETGQIGAVGAGFIGMAAAISKMGEKTTPEEVTLVQEEATGEELEPVVAGDEAPAAEELPAEQILELPEWLADLGEETTIPAAEETWTPDQAALTGRLKKFEETVPEAIPEPEIPKPEIAHLDVNRASLIELERLPGVGFVRAQALIDYRKAHGPIESMMELENVEGFDPDLVDVLRDYAAVLPKPEETHPTLPSSQAEFSLDEAQNALSRGNVDGAIQIYQVLISQTELLPDVVKDLNDALYRYPVDISIWMTLGDAEMRSGNVQEALTPTPKLRS
jgi:tetratricopeptide (TPR) repeat protein